MRVGCCVVDATFTAKLAARVVFPTPPLPPRSVTRVPTTPSSCVRRAPGFWVTLFSLELARTVAVLGLRGHAQASRPVLARVALCLPLCRSHPDRQAVPSTAIGGALVALAFLPLAPRLPRRARSPLGNEVATDLILPAPCLGGGGGGGGAKRLVRSGPALASSSEISMSLDNLPARSRNPQIGRRNVQGE